jgi:mitochondrial chaperone BCS1
LIFSLLLNQLLFRVTLSGLLNALDGVGAHEGRIIIATTNKYHALDPALIRPGRMDVHLEFKNASKCQARQLFTHFYLPGEANADSASVVDINSTAVASALATLSSDTSDVETLAEKPTSTDNFKPDKEQVRELADQFSDAIPEYELSMASLQGYLMLYKTRPFDAMKDVAKWLNKEGAIRSARERKTAQDAPDTSAPKPPLTPVYPPIPLAVPGRDIGVAGA